MGGIFVKAGVAQLVEQLICNQQVAGSTPVAGLFHEISIRLRLLISKRILEFYD